MPMRMRAEKKMRKHLLEQLKSRKILGARIADGEKTGEDLQKLGMAPSVYVFKNLFSGQVLYSQVPALHQYQIDQQFTRPNWENRKPSRRSDSWRIMCVANFPNYEYAVAAYKGLIQLRYVRDVVQRKEADAMRKKNEEGNIWYSGQFRPTYSQEAVADISQVIDDFELDRTKLLWENVWRRGDDERWRTDLVEHDLLPVCNPRDQSFMLDDLRAMAVEEFRKEREQINNEANSENTKTKENIIDQEAR